MNDFHINLTDEEQKLLEAIDLRILQRGHTDRHATYLANKQPILALLRSLFERKVIPKERLNYWTNPEYNTQNSRKSHKQIFLQNCHAGNEIYTHPHFLPYLRYFLTGAELPEFVISKFKKQVGDPNLITSGDIEPICKYARKLVRQFQLHKNQRQRYVAEEFFKLCLDLNLDLTTAKDVRREVLNVR